MLLLEGLETFLRRTPFGDVSDALDAHTAAFLDTVTTTVGGVDGQGILPPGDDYVVSLKPLDP